MTTPLLPGPAPAYCRGCHTVVPTGRLYGGYGEKCARKRGLIPTRRRIRRVRVTTPRATPGPTLLDLLDREDNEPNMNDEITQCHDRIDEIPGRHHRKATHGD
ncbi:hypothetical protein ABZ671_00685 [Micromonospora sp. NPDC006766]|uniref:hypothetical protein n=1 Tax=Micromonospora sp. NPDC006766 TaxID=3154778 RepID=UPI0033C66769